MILMLVLLAGCGSNKEDEQIALDNTKELEVEISTEVSTDIESSILTEDDAMPVTETTEEEVNSYEIFYKERYENLIENRTPEEVVDFFPKAISRQASYEPATWYGKASGDNVVGSVSVDGATYTCYEGGGATVCVYEMCEVLEEVEYEGQIYRVGSLEKVSNSIESDVYVVPDHIRTIYAKAFAGCKFREIVIPASVTQFYGLETFVSCNNLEKVTFESSDCDGGGWWIRTFAQCPNLKEAEVLDGVNVMANTFEDCTSLTDVTISDSVISMKSVFCGCTALENVELPDSVLYMWGGFGESGLKNVKLSKYTLGVDANVFSYSQVTQIEVPENTLYFDLSAISNTGITELELPKSIIGVEKNEILKSCPALTKLVFNEMKYWGSLSVENCPKLEMIVYPDIVTVDDFNAEQFRDANLEGTLTLYVKSDIVEAVQTLNLGDNIVVMSKDTILGEE